MATLQLFIIINYSCRIIGFLHVNKCILLDMFDIGADTWMDPTHVQPCGASRYTDVFH